MVVIALIKAKNSITWRDTMRNIREIQFRLTLEGQGIVQGDTTEQKYLFSRSANVGKLDTHFDNVRLGKANYYANPEKTSKYDEFIRKLKISGAGLRHAIHIENMPFHTPQIFENPAIRTHIIGTPDFLLRGYMYAPVRIRPIRLELSRRSLRI